MNKLGNYVHGNWITGDGDGQLLYNAFNGEPIASATTKGLNFADILQYGRSTGNPALRSMSFPERGRMLRALALHLTAAERKILYHQLSDRRHRVR